MNNVFEVNKLAQFFQERSEAKGIVVLTDNPRAVYNQYPKSTKLVIVKTPLQLLRRRLSGPHLPSNTEMVTMKELDNKLLNDRILVCVGYLEKRYWLYAPLFNRQLKRLLDNAHLSIASVEESRFWSTKRWRELMGSNSNILVGKAKLNELSPIKTQVVAIGGKAVKINQGHPSLKKILAIIPQFNETDFIGHTVRHLLDQGVDVHIIDNWSTDGSYEKIQSMSLSQPNRISYERFPKKDSKKYEWTKILKHLANVAYGKSGQYDWVMLNDADELRWSPWPKINLQNAFTFVDHLGYNAVDYTLFNLVPTKDGFTQKKDPQKFFKYGEFINAGWAFKQIKSWKNAHVVDLSSSGGHHAKFSDQNIYPLKFLIAHYPLRSEAQAKRKIFKERRPRFIEDEKRKNWHNHYNNINGNSSFIKNPENLIQVDKNFYNNHILELISGIGIERK